MTEPTLSVAFFDRERRRHALARAGATLLFAGSSSTLLSDAARIEPRGEAYALEGGEGLSVELTPLVAPVELAGVRVRICRAAGAVGGERVDGLGTVSETLRAPAWDTLDALRALSVLVDEGNALLAVARRLRGARGHGDELVSAKLIKDGEALHVEDARISTVYDGDGRQRSAGLELWLPGEDFPRRGSGTATAGSSLDLAGLRVHAAVFSWRLEERDALGQYEIAVRSDQPAAA